MIILDRVWHSRKAEVPNIVTFPSNVITPFSPVYVFEMIFAPKPFEFLGVTTFPSVEVYQIWLVGIVVYEMFTLKAAIGLIMFLSIDMVLEVDFSNEPPYISNQDLSAHGSQINTQNQYSG